jgi:hypothetical protein
MSAPISPGDFSSPKATASVVTTITRAPAAFAASAILEMSVTVPNTFGVWTTTQAVSLSIAASTASSASMAAGRRTVSTPALWARVWVASA